jgi:hypothetical protein
MLISIFTIIFNNLRRFLFKITTLNDRYLVLRNLITSILLISALFYNCQKGDQSLGISLLPGVHSIETRFHEDSTSISAFTFSDDSIRVDSSRYHLLGSFNDPLFGYTSGAFAAQFRIKRYPSYESDATLDSVILQMSYKYVYGDTITPQTMLVRELTGDLFYGYKYLSSFNINNLASPDILGTKEFIPKFRTDSTKVDTTSQILRIPLDPSLGKRLIKMDSLDMVSNDKFVSVFKGLYVETAPVNRKGSLIRVDTPSALMVVYYHTAEHDSLGFGYYLSANSANVSRFVHDYTNSRFLNNMNKEHVQDSLVYLQPTGGTKVKINIPSLSSWKDSANYAINKASLTIHVDTLISDFRRYEIPTLVYLKIINDNGQEEFPKDADLSIAYYGGAYNPIKGTYTFNITQHLQQIITGEKHNNGFYLVHGLRDASPKRVVLKSGNSSRPMKFDVSYTRYK